MKIYRTGGGIDVKRIGDFLVSLFKKIATKKILLYTLAVIIIVLPVSLASMLASRSHTTEKSEGRSSVTLKRADGTVIASESALADKGSDSIVSIFSSINEEKTAAAAPPESYSEITPITAEITDASGKKTVLVCYFSIDGHDSYCVDSAGVAYSIDKLDAEDFLSTSYAESLYRSAKQPKLLTIDDETVLPVSSSWYYKNVRNVFMKASDATLGTPDKLYSITGQIAISFSIVPDVCLTYAYNNKNEKIFDGTLDDLSNLILTTEESIRITIDATWKQSDSASCYGTYSYDFLVSIADRSTFSVSSDTLMKNRFVILEATNVTDISKIKFHSDQTDEVPTFLPGGNNTAKAILTFPDDVSGSTAQLSFSISYRASMQSFTIDLVTNPTPPIYSAGFTQPLTPLFSALANEHITSTLSSIGNENNADIYLSSEFLSLSSRGFKKSLSFGSQIKYLNYAKPTFTSLSCEYTCDSYGISVSALNSGTVTAVGENDLFGKYVVVDHGMGLKTWYCYLSDVDVRVHATVVRGQSVGKTGASPTTRLEGFGLYLTFNGKAIDPESIIQ